MWEELRATVIIEGEFVKLQNLLSRVLQYRGRDVSRAYTVLNYFAHEVGKDLEGVRGDLDR